MPAIIKISVIVLFCAVSGWTADSSANTVTAPAQQLFDSGQHEAALEAFKGVAAKYPNTDSGCYAEMMIGLCYEGLEKLSEAETAFRNYYIHYPPKNCTSHAYFARVLQKIGKVKEAQAYYNKILVCKDVSDWAIEAAKYALSSDNQLSMSAQELFQQGDYETALKKFKTVAATKPRDRTAENAQMMVGLCYEHMGKLEEAEHAFRIDVTEYKPDATSYYYFGSILLRRNKLDEAKEMFKKALSYPNAPNWVTASAKEELGSEHEDLSAQVLFEQGKYQAALEIFKKIAISKPKNRTAENAQMMVGLCYERMGKLEEAEHAFRIDVTEYEPDAASYYHFGLLLKQLGKIGEAAEMFNKVIAFPNAPTGVIEAAKKALK